MIQRIWPYLALCAMGAGWGATIPLTKIAVSTGHQQFGLIFWQLAISAVVLGGIQILRKRPMRITPQSFVLFAVVATIGTIFPNLASYTAAVHLPATLLAILIATVPMFAFPIAIALKSDAFEWRRAMGLVLGITAVIILVAPDATLPDRTKLWFVPIALIGPFFYGIEGNFLSRFGTLHHGPIQTLFGASVIGMMIVGPIAIVTGHWFSPFDSFGRAEAAMTASGILHGLVYAAYVWLVASVGSVFASQVAYAVTLFAVIWSIIFLKEPQSPYLWGALICMMLGMSLVSPRKRNTDVKHV